MSSQALIARRLPGAQHVSAFGYEKAIRIRLAKHPAISASVFLGEHADCSQQ